MSEITNPQELLEKHPFTAALRKAGFDATELAELRFGKTDGSPFNLWPMWFRCFPFSDVQFVKPYCTLKWLLLDDPPWSHDRGAAWEYVAAADASAQIEAGLRSNEAQRARARKPRVKMPDDGQPMAEVVHDLARRHPDLTAKELWPHFVSELDERQLRPVERPSPRNPQKMEIAYSLDGKPRTIGEGRFANLVSAARQDKKSRQPG